MNALIAMALVMLCTFVVAVFLGYNLGYDQADRDCNDGWSTRQVRWPWQKRGA